ncbi:P-loop containing protein [Fusarium napiforme]|uniref:P-loop containing protein n=1 Tax=Fusarium napiforme TaxID=42672 RepID=A0A8H5NH18_9HYPO|nr:P-loop containing protein [Fusarium napiforme]
MSSSGQLAWWGEPIKDSDSDSVDSEVQVGEIGHICEVRDAFAEFNKSGKVVKWLDEIPDKSPDIDEEELIRKAKRIRDTYAIVCGRYPTKENTWEVRTIWINNPILQDILRNISVNDWGSAESIKFEKPFASLVHHWEQLCELAVADAGSETQRFMKLFMNLLSGQLRDTLIRVKKIMKTGCAAFSDLQFVFKPGQLFFDSRPHMGAGVCQSYEHGEVTVDQVVWKGEEYRLAKSTFNFPSFAGIRPISELSVRPAWACSKDDIKSMKAALVERGRKYEALRGIHFRFYPFMIKKGDPHWEGEEIAGRVIVDAGSPDKDEGGFSYPLSSLPICSAMYKSGQYSKDSASSGHQESHEDSEWEYEEVEDPNRLTDEQAMMTVSTMKCFSIENKTWCTAQVDDLKDIEWNTQAFDNLVIDEAEKRLLVGFIGAATNGKLQDFDDFVDGKGKGLVLLLCGPPGTGKTLTAESVSENLKRPLYRVDTSDLGMDPKNLEKNLKTALDRCARWDAILLLDEADVFLEKRTSSNLTQNEMTTIFLRVLEYYKGIMMLTTNRYLAIDPAFESRIDLSFVFQDLEPASRAKVWYNFLIREDKALAGDSDAIAKLASMPLNGRQIKSAVKTARILAASENLPLAVDHLQTVVFMRMKALKMLE